MKSLKVRRLIAEDFFKLFRRDKVDLLLTPVTLSHAPLYSDWKLDNDGYRRERSDDYFTQPVNMAGMTDFLTAEENGLVRATMYSGVPAITIPVGISSDGLPIGLQLISDVLTEKKLLSVAKWIEERIEFSHLTFDDLLY